MNDIGRLRWRCRRGMKELDLLLNRYVDEQFSGASPAQQHAFRRLLELQDPTLYELFVGRMPAPDPELALLINRIAAGATDGR